MKDQMTLRETTIFVLDKSQDEFKKLKEALKTTSDSFDAGKDTEGLNNIKSVVIPQISSFYEFCFTMINSFDDVMGPDITGRLKEKFENLDTLLKTLTNETETGNFTEIGDLLRFDLTDLINEFSVLFPEISETFKTSTREDLNNI
ncbi:MAG: hypothetical protein A2017_09750 [Lentisphaerae bacterium GWF2_44_16]|nr:MAG: hypothetical protein A2017_09750 [Lentisphaerae bacterium GWF2_44_16]